MPIYGFTGRMFSGKDAIIEKTGLRRFSLADPIYEIAQKICGFSNNRADPGVRRAWQRIGRWGRGYFGADEKEIFEDYNRMGRLIRSKGNSIFSDKWSWVDWTKFGDPDFFLNILIGAIEREPELKACAVSSIRWPNELSWITGNGHMHAHVQCSPDTIKARMRKAGYKTTDTEMYAINELMVNMLDTPDKWRPIMIWNDDVSKPNEKYLTVEEFLATLKPSQGIV